MLTDEEQEELNFLESLIPKLQDYIGTIKVEGDKLDREIIQVFHKADEELADIENRFDQQEKVMQEDIDKQALAKAQAKVEQL